MAALVTDFDLNVLGEGVDGRGQASPGGDRPDGRLRAQHAHRLGAAHRVSTTASRCARPRRCSPTSRSTVPRAAALPGRHTVATDRAFLQRDMPELESFLHDRIVDVSSIKELGVAPYCTYFNSPPKQMGNHPGARRHPGEHRGAARYYRAAVFVLLRVRTPRPPRRWLPSTAARSHCCTWKESAQEPSAEATEALGHVRLSRSPARSKTLVKQPLEAGTLFPCSAPRVRQEEPRDCASHVHGGRSPAWCSSTWLVEDVAGSSPVVHPEGPICVSAGGHLAFRRRVVARLRRSWTRQSAHRGHPSRRDGTGRRHHYEPAAVPLPAGRGSRTETPSFCRSSSSSLPRIQTRPTLGQQPPARDRTRRQAPIVTLSAARSLAVMEGLVEVHPAPGRRHGATTTVGGTIEALHRAMLHAAGETLRMRAAPGGVVDSAAQRARPGVEGLGRPPASETRVAGTAYAITTA